METSGANRGTAMSSRSSDGAVIVVQAGSGAGSIDNRAAMSAAGRRRALSMAGVLRAIIRLYQVLHMGRPSPCRFEPSCSAYAVEAIERHGAARGTWISMRRISRCRPLGGRGFDPVPLEVRSRKAR